MVDRVLIAGGGIAGLTLALSCHQVGIPFRVFEASSQMRPLGVGINLQPSAVRELHDLGLAQQLVDIGVPTRDYGLYSKRGQHIWTEPRGLGLGYRWPQYSIHRGQLHMLLLDELRRRAGRDVVETGWRAVGYDADDARLHLRSADGAARTEHGALVIGADGIHSAIRAQMVPDEGPPRWGGAILWRGTTRAMPFLSGASMVLVGHDTQRFVSYPISQPDPDTGLATVNWIAELRVDPAQGYRREDYSRTAQLSDFLPAFEEWRFDWLDVPALVRGAGEVFEYPMVDRDPLACWRDGRVSLMGDAAHATYPVGSNGAGSAIVDARKLVAAMLEHGLTADALQAYEDEMRPISSRTTLANRGAGPDRILSLVEERSGGAYERIEDVIPQAEMDAHQAAYKRLAGFGVAETNDRAPIVPPGARF